MRVAKQPERTPITDLQEMLRLLYSDAPLSYDGLYGTETEQDVRRFQRENGLPETGVADGNTWEAIRRAYKRQLVLQGQAEPLRIVLQPNQIIGKNSDNLHVFLLQALFLAMKELYLDVPAVKVTGIVDAPTVRALSWFQERAGLEPSGELDKLTWKHLVHEYRQLIGDGTGSFPVRIQQPPEPPEEALRRGAPT